MNRTQQLDRLSRLGMACGIGLILQPWWSGGLQTGFFVTAVFTILYIITSHLNAPENP